MKKLNLSAILWLVLIALAASNVLLIRQNLLLRRQSSEPSKPQPNKPKEGDKISSFDALGLNGETVKVDFDHIRKTRLLIFFSPNFPFSRQQFQHWKQALEIANRKNIEAVGLAGEGEDRAQVREYLRANECLASPRRLLSVAFVSDIVRRDCRLNATPTTLIVSKDGVVKKAWVGRWSPQEAAPALAALEEVSD